MEKIARREHQFADAALAEARRRSFSDFLRGVFALKPIYYTLRDIWYELHFVASNAQDRSEFEYFEAVADEMQADIGQMILHPSAGPMLADVARWDGKTVANCRRWLDFWERSRIQINHAIAQKIRAKLDSSQGHIDGNALRQEVQSLISGSLSDGQRLATTMFDTELARLMEERRHESARVSSRAT